MFIYCCETVGFSKDQKCKICQRKASWFCQECENWYNKSNRSHLNTTKHKKNEGLEKQYLKETKIKIFGFNSNIQKTLQDSTKTFITSTEFKITNLKYSMIVSFEKDYQNDFEKFYLFSVKKNEICDETKTISEYFNDLDFVVLKKKSYIESEMDKLLDYITNLIISSNKSPSTKYQLLPQKEKYE